jgi:hypothetical protein
VYFFFTHIFRMNLRFESCSGSPYGTTEENTDRR